MRRSRINPIRRNPRPGRLKGKDLAKMRRQRYEMDGGRCVKCGEEVRDDLPDWHPRKYHLAHIKAKRIGGDSIENTRTLCGECHRKEHNANGKPCPPKPRLEEK